MSSNWLERLKKGIRFVAPSIYKSVRMTSLSRGEKSYSQEGEDRVLARYFESVQTGFYVDVGAHDPMRFSNTFLFYRRGWRGVNIDAMPGSMTLFQKYRPGDVNLEVGIGNERAEIPFYVFNEPALNSFDQSLSKSRDGEQFKIVDVINVPVRPLAEVLDVYLPRRNTPSFLTVDVEGRDLDALKSNDWTLFRPTFVLAECLGATVESARGDETTHFMLMQGYQFVAKTMNTAFYRADDAGTGIE